MGTIATFTNQPPTRELDPFTLEQLGIAFVWLLAGNMLSLGVAIWEIGNVKQLTLKIRQALVDIVIGILRIVLFVLTGPKKLWDRANIIMLELAQRNRDG